MVKVFAKVSNVIVRNPNLSHTEKLIYVYICFNGFDDEYVQMKPYSLKELLELANLSVTSRNLKHMKESLLSLVDTRAIHIHDSAFMDGITDISTLKENDFFYIRASERFYEETTEPYEGKVGDEKGFFTAVYKEDFLKFIKLSKSIAMKSVNTSKLMTAYLVILSRANIDNGSNKSNRVSFESTEDLATLTNLNKKTLEKYVKLLCSSKMLFKVTVRISSIKKKNVYSRWCDRHMPILMGDENKSHVFNYLGILSINNFKLKQSDSVSIMELIKLYESESITPEWVDGNVISLVESD